GYAARLASLMNEIIETSIARTTLSFATTSRHVQSRVLGESARTTFAVNRSIARRSPARVHAVPSLTMIRRQIAPLLCLGYMEVHIISGLKRRLWWPRLACHASPVRRQ